MEMLIACLVLVWCHFVGDFLLQTDAMAINKSKSNLWLTYHVFAYAAPLWVLSFFIPCFFFVWANIALHWCVDYATSRITSKLWKEEKRHWFFVVIGFDQAIHFTCLFLTYWYMVDR